MSNVILFIYGLLEDQSIAIKKVCEEVTKYCSCIYLYEGARCHLHSLLKMFHKERPEALINPLYNEWVCCMNEYSPEPDKPTLIYYCDGEKRNRWINYSINPYAKKQVCNTKPCVVLLEVSDSSEIHDALQGCNRIHQLIKCLVVRCQPTVFEFPLSSEMTEEYIPSIENEQSQISQPLCFANKANVEFFQCDFQGGWERMIIESLKDSSTLAKFSLTECRNIPTELLTVMGKMKDLRNLIIYQCNLTTELCHELCSQITSMKNLENFTFGYLLGSHQPSPTLNSMSLTQALCRCPLQKLRFPFIPLSGVISVVCKNPEVNLRDLKELDIRGTDLAAEDVLGLRKMIHEGKMSALQKLNLEYNDFVDMMSDSLEKLLQTIDQKLENCRVFVTERHLPEVFNCHQYKCLRVL